MSQSEQDGDETWNPDEMESYLNERDSRKGFYERHRLEEKWAKFMYRNLIDIFGLDLYTCTKFHNCHNHRERTQLLAKKRKLPNLSRIVRVLYVWTNLRILILVALQYRFDNHELQRDRLIKQLSAMMSVSNQTGSVVFDRAKQFDYNHRTFELTSALNEISYDLVAERKWLKTLGTPYLEYEFGSECVAIVCVLLGLSLYLQVNWIHDNILPPNFSLLRMFLNRENERRNLIKMTVNEVDKFLASSYEYALVQAQTMTQQHTHIHHRKFFPSCANNYEQSSSFRLRPILHNNGSTVANTIAAHRKTIRRIKKLFIEGKLEPINRDARYLNRLSTCSIIITIYLCCAFVLYNTLNTQILPLLFCDRLDYAGFMDYLCSAEISLLGYLTCFWAAYGMSLMITHLIDIIGILIKLNQQIKRFLSDSVAVRSVGHLKHLSPSRTIIKQQQQTTSKSCASNLEKTPSQEGAMTEDQLESALLAIYLQYRFLLRQLGITRPLFGLYLAAATQVMLMIPLLLFIHYPYIQVGRPIFIGLAGAYLVCGDFCVLPVCYMHGRCLDMYRLLFGLFAHVIGSRFNRRRQSIAGNHSDEHAEIEFYDTSGHVDLFSHGHTMWLLHKELKAPERLASQFVFEQYGMANTYPNIMKLHFYLGLLMLFSLLLGSRIDVTTQEAAFLASSFNAF